MALPAPYKTHIYASHNWGPDKRDHNRVLAFINRFESEGNKFAWLEGGKDREWVDSFPVAMERAP